MLGGFFGNLIFAIITWMLCRNHLNYHLGRPLITTNLLLSVQIAVYYIFVTWKHSKCNVLSHWTLVIYKAEWILWLLFLCWQSVFILNSAGVTRRHTSLKRTRRDETWVQHALILLSSLLGHCHTRPLPYCPCTMTKHLSKWPSEKKLCASSLMKQLLLMNISFFLSFHNFIQM